MRPVHPQAVAMYPAPEPFTEQEALAALADRLKAISRPEQGDPFPHAGLHVLRESGLWGAGLDVSGPALDSPGILRLMQLVGRASLPLGRLFEGHVNALALISTYGAARQREQAAADVLAGHLYSVWNTEGPDGVRLQQEGETLSLRGAKTFASGGQVVSRPLLPVDSTAGRQLLLLRADDPASQVYEVPGSWRPMGMAATHSVKLDFTGSVLRQSDLIGAPGDYYRQPMFSAGALRFCAVQLGGADTLLSEVRRYLTGLGRQNDDVQLLRFADVWLGLQAASLSLRKGARLEQAWKAGQASEEQLLVQVDAVHLATENGCLALLEAAERAVGARGLIEPEPFARLIRDLRMYLRQPAPDAARLRLGRWVMGEHADLLRGSHDI